MVADPRTKNHAYYAKVELSFIWREKKVVATRYAEAWYLTGGTSTFPVCDETKPHCWFLTDHFFVGLPNGDIADIFVDHSSLSVAKLTVDQPVQLAGGQGRIYRDQPDKPIAKELGPCLEMDEDNIHDVTVVITRDQGDRSRSLVFAPEEFYRPRSYDGAPCSRLIKRIKGQTVIEPR